MSLNEEILRVFKRMEATSLEAAANEALDQDLQVILAELQTQRETLHCARSVLLVQRHAKAKRGQSMACGGDAIDELITKVETTKTAVTTNMDRLLDLAIHNREDGDRETTSDSSVDSSLIGIEGDDEERIQQASLNDNDCNLFDSKPSTANQDDAAEKVDGAPVPDTANVEVSLPPEVSSSKSVGLSSGLSSRDGVVIDTRSVLSFPQTCLYRCHQLNARLEVSPEELGELFRYIEVLVPLVDDCIRPLCRLPRLVETIDLAFKMVKRPTLDDQARSRLMAPTRIALFASRHSKRSDLAARVGAV